MNLLLILFPSFLLAYVGANVESRKLLWANDIQIENGEALGRLEIFQGENVAEAVDAFVRSISVDVENLSELRGNLLSIVCESETITCPPREEVPLAYRRPITDQHGNDLGAIEINENEEAIDAVMRFFRRNAGLSFDSETRTALKEYVFAEACGIDEVLCSRDVAIVFDQMINEGDGSLIGRLVIFENEEPADKVYKFCEEKNVVKYYDFLVNAVCESDTVICKGRQLIHSSDSSSKSDTEEGYVELPVPDKHRDKSIDDFFATCAC